MAVVFAGGAPYVVHYFFQRSLLASPEWIAGTGYGALVFVLVLASGSTMAMLLYRDQNRVLKTATGLRLAVDSVLIWLMYVVLFLNVMYKTIPMTAAAIIRDNVSHTYTVARFTTTQSARSHCATRLEFQDMPFLAKDVCVMREYQLVLQPGMKVNVNGLGSSLGVFADSITPAE